MTKLTHSNTHAQHLFGADASFGGVAGSLRANAFTGGRIGALRADWSSVRGVIMPSFAYRLAALGLMAEQPCDEQEGPT